MKASRLKLCCNCNDWKMCHNPEIGVCVIFQESDKITNTTNYDTRCIYGRSEEIEVNEPTIVYEGTMKFFDDEWG